MKIALCQTNPIIGDFAGNSAGLLRAMDQARQRGCALAIFPELSLCGYPPQDLLERPDFLRAHATCLEDLITRVTGISIILGTVEHRRGPGKPLHNAALLIEEGRITGTARKQLLPTYDVFDETRYFEPGDGSVAVTVHGLRLGLTICEDIWSEDRLYANDPVMDLTEHQGPLDCLVNISASPYYHGKIGERTDVFSALCRRHTLPLVYVNQCGGQDELLFDGHSMLVDASGAVRAAAAGFREDLLVIDTDTWQPASGAIPREQPGDSIDQVLKALTLGVRDYLGKTGFSSAVLGLSGGIDSAVTAAIACRALGPDKVLTAALPSPYTSRASTDDAACLAENLGCPFKTIPIGPAMEAYREALAPLFSGYDEDVTEQNIQARIRGNLLMALSNKFGHLLLSTGNKSEMAVGYCTLYGDMSGGLAVLADVPKQMVYELASLLNREKEIIPARIITRPPTAELKPDQLDQDDLPPYEILDPILAAWLEEHLSIDEITARGFERRVVEDIIRRVTLNEYKRRQAPIGLKVTSKAFGQGRRYPIVQRFRGC